MLNRGNTLNFSVGRYFKVSGKFVSAFVFVALLSLSDAAMAGSDSDSVRDFGLYGEWSQDCSEPASNTRTGYRMVISEAPSGQPMSAIQTGPDEFSDQAEWENVKILSAEQVSYSRAQAGDTLEIVVEKLGDKHRTVQSTRQSDGKKLIRNGKFSGSTVSIPFVEKCS